MSIPGSALTFLGAASGGDAGYKISRSLRFNSADSAYLNRTPSSAGNRKTWTWSGWVKRSVINANQTVFGTQTGQSGVPRAALELNNSDLFRFAANESGSSWNIKVSGVNKLRDPAAWYHLFIVVDTTQATASDRVKLYINNDEVSYNETSYPNQNADLPINQALSHTIGAGDAGTSVTEGYLAEVHLIDGQALAPTDFGQYDSNSVWQPKEYSSGSYGTNGFYLKFADNSSDAALGTDSSGNSNTWTVNNLSSASTAPVVKTSISYAIAPSDYPGTGTNDQSSLSFSNTWNVGSDLTITDYIIIDTGAADHTVNITPFGSNANNSYSDDLINWTTGASQTGSSTYNEGRYYWIQSTPNGYGGGLTLTSAFTSDGDSMIDSPTNYEADSGNNGGNYATFSAIDKASTVVLSNGGLDLAGNGSGGRARASFAISSGKWYFEFLLNNVSNGGSAGLMSIDARADVTGGGSTTDLGVNADTWGVFTNGTVKNNNTNGTSVDTITTGDIGMFAIDMDSGKFWYGKNGTWSNSGNPATSANPVYSNLSGYTVAPAIGHGITTTISYSFNFGQRSFEYTPPTGYKSLCTTNLTDPTITDGSTVFEARTYDGVSGASSQTGYKFSPDFVWIKRRNSANNHTLTDSVRGAGYILQSHNTNAEVDNTAYFTAFTSDGYSFGTDGGDTDAAGGSYVAWTWDAGANSSKTYTVKVVSDSGNKYRFDDFGTSAVTLDLEEGSTYVFDQSDSSNATHPLRFSTTSDGTHGSGTEYTTGVTTTGTPGQAGAKTTITVASGAPTLYYYCSAHSGMGGQANTNSTAGASNFNGSIQSTVRANPTAGFSIVQYQGSGAAGTIGHGLNASPSAVFFKPTSSAGDWYVYTDVIDGSLDYVKLNATDAKNNSTWTNLLTSTSVLEMEGSSAAINSSGVTYIAYCFASIEGYSAFGSYSGNGNASGPFIFTGHLPRFVMIKRTDAGGNDWQLYDTARSTFNEMDDKLKANTNGAEVVEHPIDFLSNGFKPRNTANGSNGSGGTYLYAAFAENPFAYARAR